MQRLDPGTLFRLEHAAGTRIAVHAGQVWITESGEPGDVFLSAGQSHVVAGAGRVVIEPLGPSASATVGLTPPTHRPPPFRRAVPVFGPRRSIAT